MKENINFKSVDPQIFYLLLPPFDESTETHDNQLISQHSTYSAEMEQVALLDQLQETLWCFFPPLTNSTTLLPI